MLAGLGAVVLSAGRADAASTTPRIASLDYALSETLLAIGQVPIAQTSATDWNKWVVEPPLPSSVADLGSSLQVNFELLSQLAPDLILTTDYVARQEPALRRIAPVERMTLYAEGFDPLERAREIMRDLGRRTGSEAKAAAYIGKADAVFANYRERLAKLDTAPVYLVNFMDARHVRVYGGSGLYQRTLEEIGLTNAYSGETNYWGFETIGIEELATAEEVRLFAFEPMPPDAMPTLAQSPLWRTLPFVKAGMVTVLPPVLTFGALPSAVRFARLVSGALLGDRQNAAETATPRADRRPA